MPGRSTWPRTPQAAVYWGSPQPDGYGGFTFAAGAEVSVRWEDRLRVFIDATGREQQSRATVYGGGELDVGGFLYLGTLASLTGAQQADPYEVDGSRPIAVRESITSVGGTKTIYSYMLGDRS